MPLLAKTGAGRGVLVLLMAAAGCMGVPEPPGLGQVWREGRGDRFGWGPWRLRARGRPFASALRQSPAGALGNAPLSLGWGEPPPVPRAGAGAVQSRGRREPTGQAARHRQSGCQRHFASPDSFNINIYLNDKTPSPATYSAARLQLSGMTVTAPTDGRLVWA